MSVILIADVSYQVSTPEEGSDEPKILGNKVLINPYSLTFCFMSH